MKAITIKQPWASLIAHGIKPIENRSWKTNFRGTVLIHASAKASGTLYELLNEKQIEAIENHWTAAPPFPDRPTSAIIGKVDIVDCVINHPSIWAEQTSGCFVGNNFFYKKGTKITYNWVLANAVLFDEPTLGVKGKLSFWDYDLE